MNRIILMGRMVKRPELRQTQTGTPVTSFTLAVDRRFIRDGEERKTDFFDCVAWKGSAEFICRYFDKGQMCLAEGRLQNRDWTDKDGNKRRTAEVVVDSVYFTGSKAEKDSDTDHQAADAAVDEYDDEDDLPF